MYYVRKPYNPLSLGVTASHKRSIKSGTEYDVLFPKAQNKKKIVSADADVYQTLDIMEKIVQETLSQTEGITDQLKREVGKTTEAFVKRVYEWLFQHIQYQLDEEGFEDLREPAESWRDRKKGIDCDCFSIFISSILSNAGIPHSFRIIRLLDENKRAKDYFQHVYVVVPKNNNANMSDASQYWTIDPVLDEFNKEADFIIETYDKPIKTMVTVRRLSGLGCGCSQKGQIDPQTEALLKERKLISEGKHPVIISSVNKANAIAAIDYFLKYKDNPVTREKARSILKSQESKILANTLKGLGADTKSATNTVVSSTVPGGNQLVDAKNEFDSSKVGSFMSQFNITSGGNPFEALKKLFNGGSSNANNASLRKELDKFTIPANFDVDIYVKNNEDVSQWANKLGLNDVGYVRKAIALHWYTHGQYENRSYPLKAGYSSPDQMTLPTKGLFDWVGGQDLDLMTGKYKNSGIHIGPNSLKVGDRVKFTVYSGDNRYSGIFPILRLGSDDYKMKDSLVTIAVPRTTGNTNGTWELVPEPGNPIINSYTPDTNNTPNPDGASSGISPVLIGAGILAFGGILYFNSRSEKQKVSNE